MSTTLFASYPNLAAADLGTNAILAAIGQHRCSVLIHRDAVDPSTAQGARSLEVNETDGRKAATMGALLGGGAGAILGTLLAGPFGLLGAGPLMGALLGATQGTLAGALGAGIVGTGLPDATLRELEVDLLAGKVLATYEVADREQAGEACTIAERHGARVLQR